MRVLIPSLNDAMPALGASLAGPTYLSLYIKRIKYVKHLYKTAEPSGCARSWLGSHHTRRWRMTIRIGIGGWTFAPWRGAFYPAKLPHAQELRYAAERLTSIEINGTFYRTQTPASYRKW